MTVMIISGKIHLDIGKVPAVRAAISFLYTGAPKILQETVTDILEVADYFHLPELKSLCDDYCQQCVEVTVQNCVQMHLLCTMHSLKWHKKVFEFLRGHLPEIMQQEGALTITSESVLSLLTDETLSYVEQKQFYEFIIKWVEFDLENREEFFPDLFCSLDLKRIPMDVLEKEIEDYHLVKKDQSCLQHVLNVKMKYITGQIKEEGGVREAILVAGGVKATNSSKFYATDSMLAFICAENRWVKLSPLPYAIACAVMTFCSKKNCLYIRDQRYTFFYSKADILKFDLNESKWSTFAVELPENYSRGNLYTILACSGKLYAIVNFREKDDNEFQFWSNGEFYGSVSVNPDVRWETFVVEIKEEVGQFDIKQYLFDDDCFNTKVKACTIQDKKICILSNQIIKNTERKVESTNFFVFDTETNKADNHTEGAQWDTDLVPVGDEVVVTRMGKSSCMRYSLATQTWKHTKEHLLPNPFAGTEESSLSDGKRFYWFGKDVKFLESSCETWCYNFTKKKWKNLQELPQPLLQSATCLAQVPNKLSKCHIKCPHCKFYPPESRTSYDIPKDLKR
jgi:hypothetical protein